MVGIEERLASHRVTSVVLARSLEAGRKVHCTCCGASFLRFAPLRGRPNRRCWRCGSLERHRQIALLLRERPLASGLRILHVAPEHALRRLLEVARPSQYLTADLEAPDVDMNFDLTDIPLPDATFDLIVCNHVMEHVPDDRAAMRELRRILAPDGWALLMTPIVVEHTDEDASVTDPRERLRRFGQEDHVRRYGMDYVDRLREAGLSVEVIRLEERLSEAEIERNRLNNTQGFVEPMFLAS
jgi:SAM-dependent methyltransferase